MNHDGVSAEESGWLVSIEMTCPRCRRATLWRIPAGHRDGKAR